MTLPELSCHSLARHPLGPSLTRILAAALGAVDARHAVRDWAQHRLPDDTELWVLAAGKAALAMAQGLLDARGPQVTGGVVAAKHATTAVEMGALRVVCGGHPIPTNDSVCAAEAMEAAARQVPAGAAVVGLLSGGASALVTAPVPASSLEQIAELTAASLQEGLDIRALNRRRATLDRLKGGGLARAIPPGRPLYAGVIGDVIGAPPHAVGSGLLEAEHCQVTELRNNNSAVEAAAQAARALGMDVDVRVPMTGIARNEGIRLAQDVLGTPGSDVVRCTIAGGETRVVVRGDGQGGRNQELALAAAPQLMGHPHALLATLATDGEDGPTDAAGAVASGDTVVRALEAGLDPNAYLQRNDAYRFFDRLDDLLRPGPTHTNVCDLTVLLS